MIDAKHHDSLAGVVAVALGLASEEQERVTGAGFELDAYALELESQVCVAAVDGRWGDVLLGLLACAATDPEIYLPAWRSVAEQLLAAMRGSANGPPPTAIPLPPMIGTRQWSSSHGSATVLPSGDLRILVPLDLERSCKVTLPLLVGGRHGFDGGDGAYGVDPAALRRARDGAGLTQAAEGDLLGVTKQTVSKWERGVSSPTVAELQQLAVRLGRPVDFFLRRPPRAA